MTDLATFIVTALLTLGIGTFLLLLALGAWRHVQCRRRLRRRIGWYTHGS